MKSICLFKNKNNIPIFKKIQNNIPAILTNGAVL